MPTNSKTDNMDKFLKRKKLAKFFQEEIDNLKNSKSVREIIF